MKEQRGGKNMSFKVHPWGNSSAVPVPSHVRKVLGIENGSEVEIEVKDGAMIVKPVKKDEGVDQAFIDFLKKTDKKFETVTRNLVDR
jgi:AbrB family looped-hinge helix DNA binding protein